MTKFLEKFYPPTPIAWFFFILGFGTCMALGVWQVERLEWKNTVFAQLEAAKGEPPRETLPETVEELKALQFNPVRLKGSWIKDVEFHITPRYLHDQFGYALISPFKLTDGRIVLVNRGWIPGAYKNLETRPESHVKGKATITGMVRVGAERSSFTPVSQPDKNLWFGRDIADMAAYAKLDNVVPAMVDQTVAPGPDKPAKKEKITDAKPARPDYPIPSDGTIKLRNDHMGYIITWFGIALGILVIFITYHRRK